jgi:hypothetical protein
MKTVKKTIFATLVVAMMGILITKVLPSATVNDLFDQNVEALAAEDPNNPIWVQGSAMDTIIIYIGNTRYEVPCCTTTCNTDYCNINAEFIICNRLGL